MSGGERQRAGESGRDGPELGELPVEATGLAEPNAPGARRHFDAAREPGQADDRATVEALHRRAERLRAEIRAHLDQLARRRHGS